MFVIQTLAKIDSLTDEIEILQAQAREGEDFKQQFYNLDKKMQKVIRAFEKKVSELQKVIYLYSSQELQTSKELESSRPTSVQDVVAAQVQTDPTEYFVVNLRLSPSPVPAPLSLDQQKDVFYYRNANKELKSKLREVVAVNHRLAKTIKAQNGITSTDNPSLPAAADQV